MRSTIWGCFLVCTACGSTEVPTVMVQDSAGVRLVESSRPAWGDDQPWEVSPEAVLNLGTVDGDAAFSFDRISGAYVLDGDLLAVLDAGAREIRFFDLDGNHRSTFGRPGQGPGEFQSLIFLGLYADSLWLFDGRQQRITVLDPEGGGFRVARAGLDNVGLGPVGLLPDGSAVLVADLAFSSPLIDELPPGLQRFGAAYVRIDSQGALQDTILVAQGSERILAYSDQAVQMLRPLLPRSVSHAVREDEILQGSQDTYQIGVFSAEGELRSLIRRSDVDVQMDEAAYSAVIEERVLRAPEPARPGLRSLYQDQARPESRPAYSGFLVDGENFLWVQDFSYSGEARSWAVFDPEGVWLGVVEFPDRFRPTQILRDRVVGIWRDELEVEYARIYELARD